VVAGPPKTAIEVAMEKLARQDAESGTQAASLTDTQRDEIAEARRVYDAHVAESQILYDSNRLTVSDPEARRTLEEQHRRDLARFVTDRDKKISAITPGSES